MDKTINQNLIVKGSLTADSVITQKIDEPIGKIIIGTGDNFATQSAVQNVYIGTWEQIKDVFLLAAGDTYIAGSTGGEANHTLTVDEMPSHNHSVYGWGYGSGAENSIYGNHAGGNRQDELYSHLGIGNTGGNQPHNNMPPYLTVYMWRRIA